MFVSLLIHYAGVFVMTENQPVGRLTLAGSKAATVGDEKLAGRAPVSYPVSMMNLSW